MTNFLPYIYLGGFLLNLLILLVGFIKSYYYLQSQVAALKNDIGHMKKELKAVKENLKILDDRIYEIIKKDD